MVGDILAKIFLPIVKNLEDSLKSSSGIDLYIESSISLLVMLHYSGHKGKQSPQPRAFLKKFLG